MTENNTKNTLQQETTKTGPQWGRILPWVGLTALLVLVGVGLIRTQEGPVSAGQKAPDFILTTFDGQEIALSDLEGKVVVLNFWASWCKPCESEAADLEAAWRSHQSRENRFSRSGVIFDPSVKTLGNSFRLAELPKG